MSLPLHRNKFGKLLKKGVTFWSRKYSFKSKWITTSDQNPGVISSASQIQPIINQTIPEFLRVNLHKYENAPAVECAISGRCYTHGQVHRKGQSFAGALKAHGLKREEAVAILLPNIPEYPIAALGVWDAGLVASPINPGYTIPEIGKQVNDCGAKVIVTLPELVKTVTEVQKQSPTLKSIVVVGKDTLGHHSFFEMTDSDPSNVQLLRASEINCLKDTVVLPYSSGTTGQPKGVELTNSTFTTNLVQMTHPLFKQTQFFEGGREQERLFALLPFFHMYGLQIILASSLYQGAHTLCFPKFEPASFIQGIKKHKPTVLHLVTPLINFMCQTKELTHEDLKSVRGIIAGAAPIGKTLIERFVDRFDHFVFFQEGFGMTELSSVSHIMPPELKNSKAGSSGILVPSTTSKILDLKTGKTLGPNQPGELCIKGPQVMKGYYKNETASSEAFDNEGAFLKTGDIGYYDEQGFLYIVDRSKDLIKAKGLQVAPAELEDILRLHPDVADVAVVGVAHEKWGEAARAFIVPKNDSLKESHVHKFLDGKVAEHKKLEGGVHFIKAIPKAASGKILRRMLKETS